MATDPGSNITVPRAQQLVVETCEMCKEPQWICDCYDDLLLMVEAKLKKTSQLSKENETTYPPKD
jgi:hypothetical protein